MSGTNDSIILFGIVLFLALTALAMPILSEGLRVRNYNSGINEDSINTKTPFAINDTTITAGIPLSTTGTSGIIKFLVNLLFWFSDVPVWFNLIFLILRIMVVWLVFRLLRSGGG